MWDNMGTSGETGEIGGAGAGVDLTLPNHLPRGSRLPQLRSRHEPVHLRQSHTRLVKMLHIHLEFRWNQLEGSLNTKLFCSGQYQGSAGGQPGGSQGAARGKLVAWEVA